MIVVKSYCNGRTVTIPRVIISEFGSPLSYMMVNFEDKRSDLRIDVQHKIDVFPLSGYGGTQIGWCVVRNRGSVSSETCSEIRIGTHRLWQKSDGSWIGYLGSQGAGETLGSWNLTFHDRDNYVPLRSGTRFSNTWILITVIPMALLYYQRFRTLVRSFNISEDRSLRSDIEAESCLLSFNQPDWNHSRHRCVLTCVLKSPAV